MTNTRRLSAPGITLLLLAIFTLTTGFSCNDTERATFNSLAASKAVIDQAGADYNAGAIAQTQSNRDLIEKARSVHDAAVDAFHAYKVVKEAGQNKAQVDAALEKSQAALRELSQLQQALQAIPRVKRQSNAKPSPHVPLRAVA